MEAGRAWPRDLGGFGLVRPENDELTFAARPRAPLAAPATAAAAVAWIAAPETEAPAAPSAGGDISDGIGWVPLWL
jgi:hypothetical protein